MENHSWNILLIDDDSDDYVLTQALLAEARGPSFDLRWANSYSTALQALDEISLGDHPLDAILMDYDLGGRTGVDLIYEVNRRGCQAPILLLTGRGSYEVDVEAMQAGASDYLSKGEVNARMLERAIRYAIERKATELALSRARDQLELRVQERTYELQQANAQLADANLRLEAANDQLAIANAQLAGLVDSLQAEIQERMLVEAQLHSTNESLREREARLNLFLEQIPAVVWTIDCDLRFTSLRGRGLADLGLATDRLVGVKLEEFVGQALPGSYVLEAQRRALQGEAVSFDEEAGGRYYQVHVESLRDSAGEINGAIGLALDSTRRVRAERARRESEDRLRMVVNAAPLVLWAMDSRGVITFQEGKGLEAMGLKPGALVGQSVFDYLGGRPDEQAIIRRALAGEAFVQVVASNEGLLFETHYSPSCNPQGEVTGVIAVSTNVTELVHDQARLAYQARLLENVNDAIIATDADFKITVWNRAAEAIYGWKAHEIYGRDLNELLNAETAGHELEEDLRQLQKTGSLSIELAHHHRDGRPIYIEAKLIALTDADGRVNGYASVNRDITRRRAAQEQLRRYALRTTALAEISAVLAEAGVDIQGVLDTITNRVAEFLDAACVISLLSPDQQWLHTASVHHPDPDGQEYYRQDLLAAARRVDEGLRGQVVRSGQPLRLADVDPETLRAGLPPGRAAGASAPLLNRFVPRSLLIVPLRAQGQVIGTLGISRSQMGQAFSDEDQDFLANLAGRAALAIANAQLFAALKTELAERTRAETALRESQERLNLVVHNAPVILWAVDHDGTFTFYEGRGLGTLGRRPDQQTGASVYQSLKDRPRVLAQVERALRGEVVSALVEISQGQVYETNFSPLRDSGGGVTGVIGVSTDVTERYRAQEQLAYQARLLENVNDAIIATDTAFNITVWNRAAEAIYGWTAGEAVGLNSHALLGGEQAQVAREVENLRRDGRFSGELVHHHRSGRPVDIETKGIATYAENGSISGYVSVNRDISERKQAERQIRRHSERAEALAELSSGLAETGMDTPRLMETVARRVVELVGDFSLLMFLSPDREFLIPSAAYHPDPEAHALLERLTRTAVYQTNVGLSGQVVQTGEPVLTPDTLQAPQRSGIHPLFQEFGERFGIYSTLIVPLRAGGQVIGTLGVSRNQPGRPYSQDDLAFLQNIADRAALAIANARLFEALNRSEARFRAIFEDSAMGIKLNGLDGRILAANPAMQELLGYSEAELVGLHLTDLVHPEDIAASRARFDQLISGEISRYQMEKRYVRKDGGLVWARQTTSMVRDEAGRPRFVVVMVENISEHKQFQAELEEVKRRLIDSREAERLHLSQEIHDGPMQELYGLSYMVDALKHGTPAAEEAAPGLGNDPFHYMQVQIKETIQDLRVICGQLRPPTLAPFGLEKTLRSHADSFRRDHPEITLDLELQPDGQALPESLRLALYRVYQQSLANVVRHAGASQVQVRFHFDAESALLEIQDNGRGFSVPRRWVSLVRAGHLGLAGAAERAEAVGGRLEVESSPGAGSLVRVMVPLVQ